MLKFTIGALVLLELAAAPATIARQDTSSPPSSGLTRLLQAEIARFPGKAGVYVKHLATGEEAEALGAERFNSASVIKLPVMALAYELADTKQLDLDERVSLKKGDIRGGSGIFRFHDLGLAPTWRDVIRQMIVTSDNTATDLAIARVGGVDRVNRWIRERDFAGMALHHTIFEVFRKRYELFDPGLATLTPEELYALQTSNPAWAASSAARLDKVLADLRRRPMQHEWNRRSSEDPAYWLGAMTPRDTGRLLEGIERGTLASRASCEEMKGMLRQQQAGARRLPHYLDIPVGHKTGDLPPVVANDAGIAYARTGPIVIAFFSLAIRGPYGEAEDRIGQLARLIVDYFDGGPATR